MNNEIKKWITINHVHIPIQDGQSKRETIRKFFEQKKSNNKIDNGKYEKDYKKFIKNNKGTVDILAEKHYVNLRELGLNDNELSQLNNQDVYEHTSNGRKYKSVNEYKKIIEEKKKQQEKENKMWEERQKEYKKISEQREKRKQETMKIEGVSSEQYDKEYQASYYRDTKLDKVYEAYDNLKGKTRGYSQDGKSSRAVIAEYEGKFPKSEASKMLGVTEKMIEKYCPLTEWHHSSGTIYKEVDYYDINKYIDIANGSYLDYLDEPDYEKEVENWIKMTHRKKR